MKQPISYFGGWDFGVAHMMLGELVLMDDRDGLRGRSLIKSLSLVSGNGLTNRRVGGETRVIKTFF